MRGSRRTPKFSLVTSTDPLRHKQWQAQKQGTFSDFEIKVDGVRIPCHKLIVSSQSAYFSCMLQHETTEEVSQGSVDLKLLGADAVKLVVDFMYSGRIEFNYDMVQEVIKVVNYFQLTETGLQKSISEFIISHLCPNNCLGWFSFGDQMNLEKIKTAAQAIMLERFSEVCIGSEFVGLIYNQLTPYIQQVIKSYSSHDQCLKAFVTWAMHDVSERSQKFGEILQIVNLSKCSASVLKNIYNKNGKLLLSNFDLLHQFIASLSQDISEPTLEIIVAGGCLKDRINRKIWILNLESGNCIEKASQPKGAFSGAMCAAPDGLVCAGGTPTKLVMHSITDCVLYHKSSDTWVELPSLPAPTCNARATCVQDALLMVVGGYRDQENQAMYLDLRTRRSWTICDDMPQGMKVPIVGSIDEYVYVISSLQGNEMARNGNELSVQCYNTTTHTWTIKSPLPESVQTTCGAQAVTMGGHLYLIGGAGSLCARYDPACDNWTALAAPQNPRKSGAALVMNNKILLSGGWKDKSTCQDSIEEYDPATNTWRLLPVKLPTPLFNHCMVLG